MLERIFRKGGYMREEAKVVIFQVPLLEMHREGVAHRNLKMDKYTAHGSLEDRSKSRHVTTAFHLLMDGWWRLTSSTPPEFLSQHYRNTKSGALAGDMLWSLGTLPSLP
jgi:hypothetical protein